jgi:type IV pilus assembly protein PilQ
VLLLSSSVVWGADTNKLNDVSVEVRAGQPSVVIQTSEPVGYRYTVYDSFDPTRVVIDFPGMQIASVQEVLPVNSGSVKEVRTAGFDLSSGQLARVEILLAEATDYQVNLDGKNFAVAFDTEAASETVPVVAEKVATVVSKADPGVAASMLNKVDLNAGKAVLLTDGKINKIQHFVLSSPPRLVVDIYGVKPLLKSVRLWLILDSVKFELVPTKTRPV